MPFSTVKIAWTYDALNRLRVEQRDEGDDGIQNGGDYTDTFAFDLAGNRIRRIHDVVGTAQDETVLSTYDGRDRLISADSTNNLNDAIHGYDLNGSTISVTTAAGTTRYVWDLRNRLVGLNADGNLNAFGRDILTDAGDVTFAYDFAGVRIRRSVIGDQETYYLQTQINPTGYSQVLEEWTNPGGIALATLARSYVIGLDVLGQLSTGDENQSLLDQKLQWAFEWSPGWRFTMDWDEQAGSYSGSLTVNGVTYHALATPVVTDPSLLDLKIWQGEPASGTLLVRGQVRFSGQGATVTAWAAEEGCEGYTGGFRFVRTQLAGAQYLLYDGGGHTRGLLDATGQPLTAEIYAYDAFGNRIEGPSVTATNLLYRGEYFDATLGQYVLRARYYDPTSGRFWSFDSYEGNTADPLSLHKYLYANADPIGNADPTGFFSLNEMNVTQGIQNIVTRITSNPLFRVARVVNRALDLVDTFNQIVAAFQNPLVALQLKTHFDSIRQTLTGQVLGENAKLSQLTVAHVEGVLWYLATHSAQIAAGIVQNHLPRIQQAIASTTKPVGKRDRLIIYLPSLWPLSGERRERDEIINVPGGMTVGDFPLALGLPTTPGGGRLFGVGFSDGHKKSHYQLFRVDWHGVRGSGEPGSTYFRAGPPIAYERFVREGALFHVQIPMNCQASRG